MRPPTLNLQHPISCEHPTQRYLLSDRRMLHPSLAPLGFGCRVFKSQNDDPTQSALAAPPRKARFPRPSPDSGSASVNSSESSANAPGSLPVKVLATLSSRAQKPEN